MGFSLIVPPLLTLWLTGLVLCTDEVNYHWVDSYIDEYGGFLTGCYSGIDSFSGLFHQDHMVT